nr:hypothetical protein [Tanacetum cinerariifolium]
VQSFTTVASLFFWQWELSSLAVGTSSGNGNSITGSGNALCILFPTLKNILHESTHVGHGFIRYAHLKEDVKRARSKQSYVLTVTPLTRCGRNSKFIKPWQMAALADCAHVMTTNPNEDEVWSLFNTRRKHPELTICCNEGASFTTPR